MTQLVLDGTCAIGASGPIVRRAENLISKRLGQVTITRVAAASHPLAQIEGPIVESQLQHHVQLVLTDRSELTKGEDFGVLSAQTWRLADLGAKHALLLAGVGWGGMPHHWVRSDLAAGRLVRLDIEGLPDHTYPCSGIYRADAPPGPAGRWLLAQLEGVSGDDGEGPLMAPPMSPEPLLMPHRDATPLAETRPEKHAAPQAKSSKAA